MRLTNDWIHGDCLKELQKMDSNSVDLIITSPPYHNLRVYSNDPCDLSNCESYEEYYYLLGLVIKECERVLKPGCKFAIQYEDYNYTLGRDGHRGKESLTGHINDIFLDNKFTLWSEIIWERFTAQRAMISDGSLWMRNLKARDATIAANFGYVYVYKKQGDCDLIKASDVTLEEWASYASGVWKIPNVPAIEKHTTPFAKELCKRLIKLYSCPGDTVLDVYAGVGTCNVAALENHRNAIGIELNDRFYELGKNYFDNTMDKSILECDDSIDQMKARFAEQLAIGQASKEAGIKEKEEKKELTNKKKDIRAEIKQLEAELNALGMKKSEIKKLRDDASGDVNVD